MLPALGNNEGDGNYNFSFEPNSSHLEKLYTEGLFGQLVKNESFKESGFYSRQIADGLRAIVFNSVIHTLTCYKKYHSEEPLNLDPLGQFAKLRQELTDARARGEQVILAHHSAYGVNAYSGDVNNLDEYTA